MFYGSRKNLYQSVYEYDLPLINPEPKIFDFIQPPESEYENPWKESFKTMVSIIYHKSMV